MVLKQRMPAGSCRQPKSWRRFMAAMLAYDCQPLALNVQAVLLDVRRIAMVVGSASL